MKSVNDILQDQSIHHVATDLMKLEAGSRKKVLKMMKALEKDLIFQLIDNDPTAPLRTANQTKRLQALLQQTKDTIKTAYGNHAKVHAKDLYNLADVEGNLVEGSMNAALKADVATVQISKNRLNAISKKTLVQGKYPNQWWAKQAQGLQDKFSNEMRMGMNQNESIGKLSNRVRKNVMPVSRRNAEALVRTSQAAVVEEAKQASYEEMSDLLKGYRYSATFDSRTTQYCKAADGTIFNKSYKVVSGAGWAVTPPNHWNCRSTLIPITKSWSELEDQYKGTDFFKKKLDKIPSKTRTSMDGKVPKGTTYNKWLKSKDTKFQDKVLGKTRAEFFRNGKIKHLSQLIDQSGKPLTIDHLKKKIVAGTLKDPVTGRPIVSALSKAGKAARELIKQELAAKAELAAVIKQPSKVVKPVGESVTSVKSVKKPDLIFKSLDGADVDAINSEVDDLLNHFSESYSPTFFKKKKFKIDGTVFDLIDDDALSSMADEIITTLGEVFQTAKKGNLVSFKDIAKMHKQYLQQLSNDWQDSVDYIIKAYHQAFLRTSQKAKGDALSAFLKTVGDMDAKDSYYSTWVKLLKEREALYATGKATPKALADIDDHIEHAWFKYIEQLDDKAYSKERDKLLKNILQDTKDYDKHFAKLKDGTEYLPYDVLKALSDNQFKVSIQHKYGYRASYSTGEFKAKIGMNDKAIVYAHEIGHAVDGLFNKSKSTGFQWVDNPWVTKKQGDSLHDVFMGRAKGVKNYNNGDGNYFDDNWISDYEGRIYATESGVGSEWWSMNVQRYNDYLMRLKTIEKKLDDDYIKYEKGWKTEPDKAYVKEALKKKKIANKKTMKELEFTAKQESYWASAQEYYPDLAATIEKVFNPKKRISQNLDSTLKIPKIKTTVKGSKAVKAAPSMQSAPKPDIEVFKADTVLIKSKYKEVTSVPKLKTEIYEPEFKQVSGYKQSAGAVVFDQDTGKVWLVEPTNHFGGYQHTFPKGTLEKGMKAQQSALKEVWEESGLEIELLDVLGDYKKTTSVTRYYVGIVKKGDPTKFDIAETQAVKLVSPKEAKKLLNNKVDKKIFADFEKKWKEFEDIGLESKEMKVAFKDANKQKKIIAQADQIDELEYQKAMQEIADNEAKDLQNAKDGYKKAVLAGKEPTNLQKQGWQYATNEEKTELAISKTQRQLADATEKAGIDDAKELYKVAVLAGKSPKLAHKKIWDMHATPGNKSALTKQLKKIEEKKIADAKAIKFSKMIDDQMEEYKLLATKGDTIPDDIQLTWDLHASDKAKELYKDIQTQAIQSYKDKYKSALLKGNSAPKKAQKVWNEHATKADIKELNIELDKAIKASSEVPLTDVDIVKGKSDYIDAIVANEVPNEKAISIWSKYSSKADQDLLKKVMADNELEEFDPLKILKTKEVPKKIKIKPSPLYKDLVNHIDPNLNTVTLGNTTFDIASNSADMKKLTNNVKYYMTQYKKKMIEGKTLTKTELKAITLLTDDAQDIFLKEIDDILLQINKVVDADIKPVIKPVDTDIPDKPKTAAKTAKKQPEPKSELNDAELSATLADTQSSDLPILPTPDDIKAVNKKFKIKPSELYDNLEKHIPLDDDIVKLGNSVFDINDSAQADKLVFNIKYHLNNYKKKMSSLDDAIKPTKTEISAYDLLNEDAKFIFDTEIDDIIAKKQAMLDELLGNKPAITPTKSVITPDITVIEPTDIVAPSKTINKKDYTKYKNAKGSNPGGFYESKTNPAERWYFKEVGEDKAYNEILAAKLYEKAGVNVPDVQPMTYGNQTGVASRIVDGVEENATKLMSGKYKPDIEENFIVDAWLANWDTVGTGYDNMVFVGNKVLRVDVGGSLRYRAMGSKKGNAWDTLVNEIDSLRDPNTNHYAAKVFKNVTKKQMEIGARKVLSISDADIRQLVKVNGKHLSKAEQKELSDILIGRKKTIAKKFPNAVPKRAKPVKLKKGENVNKQELQSIEDSRGNGYTIKTDKDQIEDGDLLIYPEKNEMGMHLTSAMMKLTPAGRRQVNKMISNLVEKETKKPKEIKGWVQKATQKKQELDTALSKAIGGSFERMRTAGKLSQKDIGRAYDADSLWLDTSAFIKEGIKKGEIPKEMIGEFRDHYAIWMQRMNMIIDTKAGGALDIPGMDYKKIHTADVTQLISPLKIKEIIKKAEKAEKAIEGKLLSWEVKYGTFDKKTITNNHLIRHSDSISLMDGTSYNYRYYETQLPNDTIIRYWADPNSAKALTGRVEIISKGKVKEAIDDVFDAVSQLGIDASRMTPAYQEELYLTQLIYNRNDSGSFGEIMKDLKNVKGSEKRIEFLKNRYNGLVGRNVTDSPEYNYLGKYQAFGHGHKLTYRPDLESDPDWADFKKNYTVFHHFHNDIVSDMKRIIDGGGQMAPNTDKFRRGFSWGGMSPSMDVREGGGHYFYTRINKKGVAYRKEGITWKVDVLKRTDSLSFLEDNMGRANSNTIKKNRRSTIAAFKVNANCSGNETLFKNSLSIFDDIDRIIIANSANRAEMIAYLKKALKSNYMPDGRLIKDVVKGKGNK